MAHEIWETSIQNERSKYIHIKNLSIEQHNNMESGDKVKKSTERILTSNQSLDEAYSPPANVLEIEVCNPQNRNIIGSTKRYTEYEVRLKTNLPIFEKQESVVHRRYSDFQWLRKEIDKTVK
ncbi:SNX3_12 [Lepeophtheirus salmonis]|uniref:Sorting nexin-3 n=1 Tax=Lepeophtheirus salmonis TaxID=72036 RepID=A0A7R8CRF2_LEPSM|nr:SNX3_12 [Lepeophtheirus salmonis]CAF2867771.1 SNX3_12 [Lepeophtheirus salmonis]